MDWKSALFNLVLSVPVAGVLFLKMTRDLRLQQTVHARRQLRIVLVLIAVAIAPAAVAAALESRRLDLPLFGGSLVLVLAASLVAEWGIKGHPTLTERMIRRLMRRQVRG